MAAKTKKTSSTKDPESVSYQRNAAFVTEKEVLAPKKSKGLLGLGKARTTKAGPDGHKDAGEVIATLGDCVPALKKGLARLAALKRPRLLGKVEDELKRLDRIQKLLDEAREALDASDLGECGSAVRDAHRQLSALGGPLTVALNQELGQAAFSREFKQRLQENLEDRKLAQQEVEQATNGPPRSSVLISCQMYHLMAEGLELAAEILASQAPAKPGGASKPAKRNEDGVRIISPQELETFAEVGGLEGTKERLRRTVGVMLERSADAAGAGLVLNGVLLYGPPGTGKTLLARAVAGEYGLRFIRFSPAAIASSFQHEPAKKLRQLFVTAAEAAPCLLFLDEVDAIAGRREGVGSSDTREIVTQLLNSLEEYREVPGLVIMAATNTLDQLDPALREGRFDVRIAVPLPDLETRVKVLEVQLESSGLEVDWDSLNLEEVGHRTSGRSSAALGSLVAGAAERSLSAGKSLGQEELLAEIDSRSGADRAQTFEEQVGWDDVVLPAEVRQRLQEILLVFQKPELGRRLGVRPPAGILLYGPPGTGKTTIAKALATEVKASFYEQSAADLISKWVGESEQKVAQLFTRARNNRPSIIFIDEIDALMKRRSSDSAAPWEERVVSQFLRELDGLQTGEGVLLVGATNRLDIIDEAVRERRLVPIEVPLPDAAGRLKLLEVLCRDVQVSETVDLAKIAAVTDGMSGAGLKQVRNSAGMKALTRSALGSNDSEAAVSSEDFQAALSDRGISVTLRPAGKTSKTRAKTTARVPAKSKSKLKVASKGSKPVPSKAKSAAAPKAKSAAAPKAKSAAKR